MTYKERMKHSIGATNNAHKEIQAAIEAMKRQAEYITRHSDLLKALNSYSVHTEIESITLDILVRGVNMQLAELEKCSLACHKLYNDQVERQEVEEARHNQQYAAQAIG